MVRCRDRPFKSLNSMDSPKNKPFLGLVSRCLLVFIVLLSSPLLVVVLVLLVSDFSIPAAPVSVASQCKIVSSRVDLRSSKVCELGLSNYKAKHVFYPFERKKFRCYYDYYWASVLKVEYKDHSSDDTHMAFAEVPNEALPHGCRPNFSAAWLTKNKFKVNETYECWYMSNISQVNIYNRSLFNCQQKDLSTVEMLWRSSILFPKIFGAWYNNGHKMPHTLAGVVTGFFTSIVSISSVRVLQQMKRWFLRFHASGSFSLVTRTVQFKRICLFVAYFSLMGWLAIQYGKRVGLLPISAVHKY